VTVRRFNDDLDVPGHACGMNRVADHAAFQNSAKEQSNDTLRINDTMIRNCPHSELSVHTHPHLAAICVPGAQVLSSSGSVVAGTEPRNAAVTRPG
jgi:hypothetical protein